MTEPCILNIFEQVNLKAVEASPDAIIITDPIGKIVIFNARAELLFGYSREEVLEKKVEVLIPESLRSLHEQHRADYMENPIIKEMGEGRILKGLHRMNYEFLLEVRLAPMIILGAGIYVLAVVRRIKSVKGEMRLLEVKP